VVRSRKRSRLWALVLSVALLMNLLTPAVITAAEMMVLDPKPIELEAPVVVIDEPDASPEAPVPGGGRVSGSQLPAGETEMVTLAEVTPRTAITGPTSVCAGQSYTIVVTGYEDALPPGNSTRKIELKVPSATAPYTALQAQSSQNGTTFSNVSAPTVVTSVAGGFTTYTATSGNINKNAPYYRISFTFTMPAAAVAGVEARSSFNSEPFAASGTPLGTIQIAVPEIEVAKSAMPVAPDTEYQRGTLVEVTLDIENTGDGSLSNVSVSDQIPGGMSYVLGSSTLGGNAVADPVGPVYSWSFAPPLTLAEGASATLKYRMEINEDAKLGEYGPLTASVSASGACGTVTDTAALASLVVLAPSLEVDKTWQPDGVICPDAEVDVLVTIANDEDADYVGTALDLVVDETVPAGFTYKAGTFEVDGVAAADPADWSAIALDDLAAGAEVTLAYTMVAGDGFPTDPASAPVTVSARGIDSVTKAASFFITHPALSVSHSYDLVAPATEVQRGTQIDVSVTVENEGNVPLEGVTFVGSIPAAFDVAGPSPAIEGSVLDEAEDGTWTLEVPLSLAAGDKSVITYRITVKSDAAPGAYMLNGAVSAPSPCGGNNSVNVAQEMPMVGDSENLQIQVVAPALKVSKSIDPDRDLTPGDKVCVTITVENTGDGSAFGLNVRDTMPAGFTYVANSGTPSEYFSASPLGFSGMPVLAPGATMEFTYCLLATENVARGALSVPVVVSADGIDDVEVPFVVTVADDVDQGAGDDENVLETGRNDILWLGIIFVLLALSAGAAVAAKKQRLH